MNTYQVVLSKSYLVRVKAENGEDARRYCEFFTGGISDLSEIKDREEYNFEIEEIECTVNDTYGVEEIYE